MADEPLMPIARAVSLPESALPFPCGFCDRRCAAPVARDLGGFCNQCGVPLPDQEGSAVEEELLRVLEAAKGIGSDVKARLAMYSAAYGVLFLATTALLFMNPGPDPLLVVTVREGLAIPITLANLVWLAGGSVLFGVLAAAGAGLELPG